MTTRGRGGKVAKVGNPGRGAIQERENGRETRQEKAEFAHHWAILRAAAPAPYYGHWLAKTLAKTRRKMRANAHSGNYPGLTPRSAVDDVIA
jgi:hypothetical protein